MPEYIFTSFIDKKCSKKRKSSPVTHPAVVAADTKSVRQKHDYSPLQEQQNCCAEFTGNVNDVETTKILQVRLERDPLCFTEDRFSSGNRGGALPVAHV
ncbi:hypothetical protein ACA910_007677 [Epithemia clementina (nom. ined.)]